jgi:hypothetical protein
MRAALFALLLCAAPAVFAQNTPPTAESVRHLLDLMQSHRIVDDALSNMDAFLKQAMGQAGQGRALNAKQQEIVEQYRTDVVSMMKDELAWSKVEPDVVAIWQKTFSQKEINDLSAFYSSPSGQAIANKLPLVAQAQNAGMQKRMVPVLERIRDAARDMAAKVKAAGDEGGKPPAH